MEIPEQCCCSSVFIVNILTYFTFYSDVSIVDFEQVNAGWEVNSKGTRATLLISFVSNITSAHFLNLLGK